MNFGWVLAAAVALVAVAWLLLRSSGSSREPFEEDTRGPKDTRTLIADTYGTGALWDGIYDDAYTIQTRYLSTLEKVDSTVDARAELERTAGTPSLRCIPAELGRILDRRPAAAADVREYYACLPTVEEFEGLITHIVNELKMALSNSMKALSGDVGYTGPAPRAGGSPAGALDSAGAAEGFFLGPTGPVCDPATICATLAGSDAAALKALRSIVEPRTFDEERQTAVRKILDDGLAAIKKVDEMNTAATAGDLPVQVPVVG